MPNGTKPKDAYEPVASVPDDLKWRGVSGRPSLTHTTLVSVPGALFKLIRDRSTGAVQYFRLKDMGPEMTPKEKLDAEPERKEQVRYRVGTQCWFIDEGRWYLCEVVDRTGYAPGTGTEKRIVIKSVTGFDADRQKAWAFGELLEFPALENNRLFQRLRPLKDRYQ